MVIEKIFLRDIMLRYKINVLEELKKAGYSTYRIRKEKLLGESTMQKLRAGEPTLNMESLDVICTLLHCQLGDFIEWVPGESNVSI